MMGRRLPAMVEGPQWRGLAEPLARLRAVKKGRLRQF